MKTNEIVQPRYSGPESTPIHREIAHGVGYFASMSLGLVKVFAMGMRNIVDPKVSILRRNR